MTNLLTDSLKNSLGALGDPTRRAIFEQLSDRPSAVGDLAELLPVSRPAVSQHLKVLKDAGLVTSHRDGSRNIYSLDPDGIAQLRAYLDRFWNCALTSFKAFAEQKEKGSHE
jgi:DNA-binding transcriptional ArsR family regulator